MTETKIELRKLTPSKGMILTDGTTYKEDFVYLGKNDSAENWHEITKEEYDEILREKASQEDMIDENIH